MPCAVQCMICGRANLAQVVCHPIELPYPSANSLVSADSYLALKGLTSLRCLQQDRKSGAGWLFVKGTTPASFPVQGLGWVPFCQHTMLKHGVCLSPAVEQVLAAPRGSDTATWAPPAQPRKCGPISRCRSVPAMLSRQVASLSTRLACRALASEPALGGVRGAHGGKRDNDVHATTVLCVRKDGQVSWAGLLSRCPSPPPPLPPLPFTLPLTLPTCCI